MTKQTKAAPVDEQPEREPELSAYQREMRNRLLAAPVVPVPEPWQPVFEYAYGVPVGGLLGIGFATRPDSGPRRTACTPYLSEQSSPEADAALRRLNLCEAAGDFEGSSVEAHAARYAAHYAP